MVDISAPTSNLDDRPDFKILAIDGGGIKGLYSSSLLSVIEDAHGSLSEHFDLLCGTSTGGLIVLGLSIGKSATEIANFYRDWGPKIFAKPGWNKRPVSNLVAMFLNKSRYSDKMLKEAAKSILRDSLVRDSNSYLCIPSFDMTSSAPRVFKTDHSPMLTRDSDIKMWQIALATCAAPSYFPIATTEEKQAEFRYIDGGVWANNPSLVGLTEACRFFVGQNKDGSLRPYKSIRLLSVGNVQPAAGRLASSRYALSISSFAGELLEAVGEAQLQSTDYYVKFLKESLCVGMDYVRIPMLKLSGPQSKGIGLDTATDAAIQTLINLGARQGHEWKMKNEIKSFFDQKKPKPVFRTHP